VYTAPAIVKIIKIFEGFTRVDGASIINRITPKDPIFSRMAARIIDPAKGASTCALGSQM
jgi:hypothetical protein